MENEFRLVTYPKYVTEVARIIFQFWNYYEGNCSSSKMMNDPLIRVMLQMKWQQNTDKITHHRHIYIKQINTKWALWWTLTEKRGRQLLGWKRSILAETAPPENRSCSDSNGLSLYRTWHRKVTPTTIPWHDVVQLCSDFFQRFVWYLHIFYFWRLELRTNSREQGEISDLGAWEEFRRAFQRINNT